MKKQLQRIIGFQLMSVVALLMLASFTMDKGESKSVATAGTVSFTVTTLPAGGNYAPKHVLAIWIEKDGVFVKTRKAMANARKQYLYTWKASSNYNVVDAITGSTLNSHQTHTITWDCTGLDGNVVPDGNYTLKIEFTDKHAQGPLYSIDFVKGTEAVVLTPPNQTNYINMSFSYTPQIVAIADFTANVSEACVNQSVVFTSTSTAANNWLWNFGEGANPATANTEGPHTVNYTSSGQKTVSLTINGSVLTTKTNFVTINPNASAGFSFVINGNTASFANSSQNAQTYLWDFGDGTTSTETNPMHSYTANGTYNVSLTAQSLACADDVLVQPITITAVGVDEHQEGLFEVSPNPATDDFSIKFQEKFAAGTLRIIDAAGKVCYQTQLSGLNAGDVYQVKSRKLTPGNYIVELHSASRKVQRKLLVK